MLNFKLPLDFIRERTSLTWPEIEFGVKNGWLDNDAAVELAMDHVAKEPSPSPDLLELASVLPDQRGRVLGLVERLGGAGEPFSKEKWLYLVLAWIFCKRAVFPDAFRVVEEVYATFDYPEEIAPFVRYMPAKDPAKAGENTMLEAWRDYLDRQATIFGQSVLHDS